MMNFGDALIKVSDFIILYMFPFIGDVFNALFLRESWVDISLFPVITAICILLYFSMPIIIFLYVAIFKINYKEMIAEIDAELEEEGIEPIGAGGRVDEKQEIENAPWIIRLLRFTVIALLKIIGSILLIVIIFIIGEYWSYFGFK